MSENSEEAFPLAGGIRPRPQGTAESALVAADGGLDLPPLAIHPAMPTALRLLAEPLDHLAAVERDDGGPHPEILAGVTVVFFGVERGVGQHPVPVQDRGRLGQHRAELRGVVGGAGRDRRPDQEVAAGIASDGELGPQAGRVLATGTFEEVARGVAALQTRTVDRGGRLRADPATLGCGRGGADEEAQDLPFFSSREAATQSVE
jgi:hypothetical protein